MAQVIEGDFQRLNSTKAKRKRKGRTQNLKGETMPFVVRQYVSPDNTDLWTVEYSDGTVITAPFDSSSGIPIGVQFWEYTHQEQVQDENVHITGTNNPHAMDDNAFYNTEWSVRDGVETVLEKVAELTKTGGGLLILGLVAYFIVTSR